MFSVGVIDLVKRGCVTNNKKPINTGKIISSFLIGTKELYDFVHNNPLIGKLSVNRVPTMGKLERNIN